MKPRAKIGQAADGEIVAALLIKLPQDAWVKVINHQRVAGRLQAIGLTTDKPEMDSLLEQIVTQLTEAIADVEEHKSLTPMDAILEAVKLEAPVRKIRKR